MSFTTDFTQRCCKIRGTCIRLLNRLLRPKRTADWHLLYFGGPNLAAPNFGDQLNIDLMRYFGCRYVACNSCRKEMVCHTTEEDLTCIGSMLERALANRRRVSTLWVFGSGFLHAGSGESGVYKGAPVRVCALRGQLSQQRMEKLLGRELKGLPLGDPGLLIKRIFPDVPRVPTCDVGIVAHYNDADSPLFSNIQLRDLTWKRIDIEQPTRDFVAQVAQCRFILSSAMHALICADSLGIPNRRLVTGDQIPGGDFKFRDYYSAYEAVPYRAVNLEQECVRDEDIQRFTAEYDISPEEVERICNRLEAAFPRWS